jgi:hypothetical protein
LQQEGEVVDINTAFANITAVAIAKKNDKKKIAQTSIISAHNCQKWSFRRIIVDHMTICNCHR